MVGISLMMGGLLHMLGEGAVEAGVVGAEQSYERLLKVYEWAMELQKQKREDLRDLLELRVARMDMYHLVCALLLGFCFTMLCENPVWEHSTEFTQWLLTPFLISTCSSMGCLFLSLWLSLHASTATHCDGVKKLLQYMRVALPNPDELRQLQQDHNFVRFNFSRQAGTAEVTQPVAAPALPASPIGQQQPDAPEPWNSDDHVRTFLREQELMTFFDAYTRVMLIIGINQMLQALSYYLIGVVSMRSPSGAFLSVIVVQTLAILLLRFDIVDMATRDVFVTIFLHMVPPLFAGFVVVGKYHSFPAGWEAAASIVFILHFLWILCVLRGVQPEIAGTRYRIPHRLRSVLQILEADLHEEEAPRPLPWIVSRRFLLSIAFVWVVGLCMHIALVCFQFEAVPTHQALLTTKLGVSWPEPASLFEVSALHCDRSSMFISGRFASYVAARTELGVGTLLEVGQTRQDTVFCRVPTCYALTRAESGMWQLSSADVASQAPVEVPLPAAWRVISAKWADCPDHCQAAWVAGWDGKREVIIGRLQRPTPNATWTFRHHFAIRPGLGRCLGSKSECALHAQSLYNDVAALHFSGSKEHLVLSVLLPAGSSGRTGSFLDVWDLSRGNMMGRWSFRGDHTSMCVDDRHFIFGSAGPDGPVLEAALMPDGLRERFEKDKTLTRKW